MVSWSIVLLVFCWTSTAVVGGTGRLATELEEVVRQLKLTPEELALMSELEWDAGIELEWEKAVQRSVSNVDCDFELWCDEVACSEVCKRGSVRLKPWFRRAMASQLALARKLPLCYAQWLGSHNSGITMADGYGNRDQHFTQLLKLTKWGKDYRLKTHNQYFSITDQLNMGVRLIELDIHYVKGALRLAHCGGISNIYLDYMASLLNLVAKILNSPFRWDSETIGCYPSASSIGSGDQRLLVDAMNEIADWMHQDQHKNDFLIVFLDDQLNLSLWGLLPIMRQELTRFVPEEEIFTPLDMTEWNMDRLPSVDLLVSKGKRMMFLSLHYYSDLATRNFLFYTGAGRVCEWSSPHVEDIDLDNCSVPSRRRFGIRETMTGQATVIKTCEIEYGPLSCSLRWIRTREALDGDLLKEMFDCGFNFPSPDNLTPSRAVSAIWSWAPGHPKVTRRSNASYHTVIDAEDGRWRSVDEDDIRDLPVVCGKEISDTRIVWALHEETGDELCGDDDRPLVPRHGKENIELLRILRREKIPRARLLNVP